MRCFVNIGLARVGLARNLPQNTAGNAALQIGTVADAPVPLKLHAAITCLRARRAELFQFGDEYGLQSARTRGKKMVECHDSDATTLPVALPSGLFCSPYSIGKQRPRTQKSHAAEWRDYAESAYSRQTQRIKTDGKQHDSCEHQPA